MDFQNKANYALAPTGRLGKYHIITQGVATGYMIGGFQTIEMSDEPKKRIEEEKRESRTKKRLTEREDCKEKTWINN